MNRVTLGALAQQTLRTISGTTFGIYLIHFLVYYMVYFRIPIILDYSLELGIIVIVVLTFISCSLLVFILKHIPVIKKFL